MVNSIKICLTRFWMRLCFWKLNVLKKVKKLDKHWIDYFRRLKSVYWNIMSYMAGGFTFLLFGMKSRLGSGTAMSVNYAAIICKEGKLLYHDNFTEIDIFMTSIFYHDNLPKSERMHLWLLLTKYIISSFRDFSSNYSNY